MTQLASLLRLFFPLLFYNKCPSFRTCGQIIQKQFNFMEQLFHPKVLYLNSFTSTYLKPLDFNTLSWMPEHELNPAVSSSSNLLPQFFLREPKIKKVFDERLPSPAFLPSSTPLWELYPLAPLSESMVQFLTKNHHKLISLIWKLCCIHIYRTWKSMA